MRLPSASKVERVLACPASHALPQEDSGPTAASEAGTMRHDALRWAVVGGERPAMTQEVEAWLEGMAPHVELLRGSRAEVALAYDVTWGEARLIGEDIGRNYGDVRPSEVVGSADYLRVNNGTVHVIDLKTGRGDVTEPGRNAQLLTLAVAARHVYKGHSATLSILKAAQGMEPYWQTEPVDAAALDAHETRLMVMQSQVEAAREDVAKGREPRHLNAGPQCRWCPARGACPKQSATLTQATAATPTFREQWRGALAQGNAAPVYAALQALKAEAELIEGALKDAARAGPLDVGDGRTYGWRTVERESIDAEKAWAVLGDAYGLEVARAAMTLETSKAGVERAMRLVAQRAKEAGEKLTHKAATARALGLLRESGAVETKSTERCEESKS